MRASDAEYRDWGIGLIRLIVGIVFLVHGSQKLFVYGFPAVAKLMAQLRLPMPMFFAVLVTLVEFVGGLALILGLFTRWAAILIAINMLVAVLKVHLGNGFFLPRGYEYALTLLCVSTGLALTGSGRPALDRAIEKRRR